MGNRLINVRVGVPTGALHRQFTYDDSGCVLSKLDGASGPLFDLTYDGKGLVTQSGSTSFAYESMGYRIQKGAKLYPLDGEHLDTVYDAASQVQEQYVSDAVAKCVRIPAFPIEVV